MKQNLGVIVDVGRWQTLLSISLIFKIFSVWLGNSAKGPTADFSYAQSSLTLAIGALSAIGGELGGAWFAYFEQEPVAANAACIPMHCPLL